MAVTKIRKMSSWTLLIVSIISLVVLVCSTQEELLTLLLK